jgi:hypothetical protein
LRWAFGGVGEKGMLILKQFLFVGSEESVGGLLRDSPVDICIYIPVSILPMRGAAYFVVSRWHFRERVKVSSIA